MRRGVVVAGPFGLSPPMTRDQFGRRMQMAYANTQAIIAQYQGKTAPARKSRSPRQAAASVERSLFLQKLLKKV